jgi:hypothetical protein
MISSSRKSLLALATLATIVTAGFAAPAAAQGWGGWDRGGWEDRRGWDRGRGDWGWGRRPHWHRERCWVEVRPMRVMTPWGPRIRQVEQRVCR